MAKDKDKKKKKPLTIEQELARLNRTIKQQNSYFSQKNVILRGLISGIFTALGATIGFAIVLIILSSFIQTISAVPFINDILEQTGIQRIIEYQLKEIDQGGATPTPVPTSKPVENSNPGE